MRVRTLTVAGFLSLLGPAAALAGNPCIGEARQQALECAAQCHEDLQTARDGCLNRDHECVEVCRAERGVCVEATGLEAALDQCNAVVRAAKETCRSQNSPDSIGLDQCIDQAQVVGFQCRDAAIQNCRALFADGTVEQDQCIDNAQVAAFQCRDGATEAVRPGFVACSDAFRACAEACPPVAP